MSDHHPQHAQSAGGLLELDASELHALLRDRLAVLVDVREPGEFDGERIPGALLFPLSGFDPQCLPIESRQRLVLHCGTGRRSAQAAQRLLGAGRAEAAHLAGGIQAWKRAGLPVTRRDPATGRVHHAHL